MRKGAQAGQVGGCFGPTSIAWPSPQTWPVRVPSLMGIDHEALSAGLAEHFFRISVTEAADLIWTARKPTVVLEFPKVRHGSQRGVRGGAGAI
jgi:hypothetical protein